MTHLSRLSLVSLIALSLAMPAVAQVAQPAPQPPPEGENDRRDVVVVTAQKREETVQDIAIAVTAITSDLRDEIGLNSVQDYTNFAPGLTYSTANDRIGMRGVTRTSNNFGIRSGISNYIDGVYYSSSIPAGRAPLFVERVEVVRGPQGTLYGRDSIGGALNLISKRPSDTFEGQFNIGAGNYQSTKIEATVSGPINDSLRYRVGGARIAQNEGFLENRAGLETEGNRNDEYYFEAQLEGDLGESIDWWARYNRLAWDREGGPGARTGVGSRQIYSTQFANSISDRVNAFAGLLDPGRTQLGTQVTNPAIDDRYAFNADFTGIAHLTPTNEAALEVVWHADTFDIKYLGGYVDYNYNLQQDHDDSPISRFTLQGPFYNRPIEAARLSDYTENRAWFSNEINFLSTWDGPLQVVAGVYQYQENYTQTVFLANEVNPGGPVYDIVDVVGNLPGVLLGQLGLGPPAALTPLPILPAHTGRTSASGPPIGESLIMFTNNQANNNAYGAFVQTDYQLNDAWKFTAGLRWSTDRMRGREYARYISHYVAEQILEGQFIQGVAEDTGFPTSAVTPLVAGNIPARIDLTSQLGGVDPATGQAGRGVLNANPNSADPQERVGIYYDPTTGNRYRDLASTWEEVTGVLGVDWTPDTDTLVYGKYSRGYKPGGLGAQDPYGLLIATPYTEKETVDSFEIGFKRDWADWNLTTNAVAFFYDYKNYQVPNDVVPLDTGAPVRQPAYTAYVNLPKTQITGFELETIWYPTDNFRLIFNYGYTDPEIQDSPELIHSLDPSALDPAAQPVGAPTSAGQQAQSVDGNSLPFNPKNKIALNGVYTWDLEGGSTLDASVSYFWQDISYTSIFNRSYTKVPSWDQVDGRLTWTSSDGNFAIIAWVKNVLDEVQYEIDGFSASLREGSNTNVAPSLCGSSPATTGAPGAAPANSCYTTSEQYRPPRMFGAELQIRF